MNLSSYFFGEDNEARQEFQEHLEPLIQRCYDDPALKAEFIANPMEVIARETEIDVDELPAKNKFVVHDKSDPHALYITIPVNEDALELTDEELEMVAGGIDANVLLCKLNLIKCKKVE